MKNNAIFLLIVTVSINYAWADTNVATANVQGRVIADLTLTVNNGVDVPDVVVPDSGNTSIVTLSCDASGIPTITYSSGANPFAHGSAEATTVSASSLNLGPGDATGTCGNITVTGEPNFVYLITNTNFTDTDSGSGVTLTGKYCNSDGTLDGSGLDTIYCGAQLTVSDSATPGAAGSMSYEVTVVYD